MQIQFLYFADCPSHEQALARLKKIMAEEGIDAEIKIIEVVTEEDTKAWHFIGSPTILINGKDIDPPPAEIPPALTCRTYVWSDGRYSPLPSPEMIRNSLRAALAST